jgi:cyclophilin family peptidyl-prolyl cis-trans isomerase
MHCARSALLITAIAITLFGASACLAEPAKEQSVTTAAGGVAAIDKFISDQKIAKQGNWKAQLPRPPKVAFEAGKKLYWKLETNVGDVKIQLMPEVAPMHVSSTVYLTRLGFYDGVPFHRVITQFMAQGGDPTGSGSGGPGYQYAGETDPKVKHDRGGLLSMANAGPGTDGSQFFLTFVPTPWLDGKHTIFGEVVEGQGTLKELEAKGSQSGRTSERLVIERATIETQ